MALTKKKRECSRVSVSVTHDNADCIAPVWARVMSLNPGALVDHLLEETKHTEVWLEFGVASIKRDDVVLENEFQLSLSLACRRCRGNSQVWEAWKFDADGALEHMVAEAVMHLIEHPCIKLEDVQRVVEMLHRQCRLHPLTEEQVAYMLEREGFDAWEGKTILENSGLEVSCGLVTLPPAHPWAMKAQVKPFEPAKFG